MALSQAAGIYDPIGFLAPVTLTAKILLRKLISQPVEGNERTTAIEWDAPISEQNTNDWKTFFQDLLTLKAVSIVRCLKPEDAVGDPTLIIFSDASIQACGACAYVQWELKTGTFEARLIAAKNRIAPIRHLSHNYSSPRTLWCTACMSITRNDTTRNDVWF